MKADLDKALYALPLEAASYADSVFELDAAHIPLDRIPLIMNAMHTSTSAYDSLLAARVLAAWGIDDGFLYLKRYVENFVPSKCIVMAHRLRGYDDTLTQILAAFVKYWAAKSDDGHEVEAREKLFAPVTEIIHLSETMPFEIFKVETLLNEGYFEYLPALKTFLEAIIKDPKFHHWKVADCAHLLMKFEPDFVTRTLAAHGYTLADFPNK
jgi:hypothetical protein